MFAKLCKFAISERGLAVQFVRVKVRILFDVYTMEG